MDIDGMSSSQANAFTSSYVTPDGTIIEHINDNDPRVYLVTDISNWVNTGKSKNGLSIVGFEDPNKQYNSGDHYTYYNPTNDPNYHGQYLIPSEAYDYSEDVIGGKFTNDWEYIIHGNEGNSFSRWWRTFKRDWNKSSSENKVDLLVAVMPLLRFEKFVVPAKTFHRFIKPRILKDAGNFKKTVGRNPDIHVINDRIVLTGNVPYKGKTFNPNLNPSTYFP